MNTLNGHRMGIPHDTRGSRCQARYRAIQSCNSSKKRPQRNLPAGPSLCRGSNTSADCASGNYYNYWNTQCMAL